MSGLDTSRGRKRAGVMPPPGAPSPILAAQLAQAAHFGEDLLDLGDVLVADALAAAVTAVQAAQDVLPHRHGRREAARPFATALQLPAEAPLAGEFLGTEEPPRAAVGIGVRPFDLHAAVILRTASPASGGTSD